MLGIILLSAVGVIVVAAVFTGLAWAAVQDGRDDRAFRGVHPELDAVFTLRPIPQAESNRGGRNPRVWERIAGGEFNWVFRRQGRKLAGLDAQVEILDQRPVVALGQIFDFKYETMQLVAIKRLTAAVALYNGQVTKLYPLECSEARTAIATFNRSNCFKCMMGTTHTFAGL